MKYKLILLIIVVLAVGGLIFWVNLNSAKQNEKHITGQKIRVVASFYPLYFLASEIGADKAEVFNVTPAGAEPHDYEPTTRDIVRITTSDLFIINGGGSNAPDVWVNKLNGQLKGTKTVVVAAGERLADKEIIEDGGKVRDPHVWQDPELAKAEVAVIEKGYEKADPANREYYKQNARELEDKLDTLDGEFKRGLANCRTRDFITSHAAFGYLAARYGLNQIAISGVSPDQEPSPKKLAEIADLVKKENIKLVFFESLVSPKLSETIAYETGARVAVLDPIEGISDDDRKAGRTYLTVMRDNLGALQKALECQN